MTSTHARMPGIKSINDRRRHAFALAGVCVSVASVRHRSIRTTALQLCAKPERNQNNYPESLTQLRCAARTRGLTERQCVRVCVCIDQPTCMHPNTRCGSEWMYVCVCVWSAKTESATNQSSRCACARCAPQWKYPSFYYVRDALASSVCACVRYD